MGIKVEGLSKNFGSFVAVDNVSFEVPEGELAALLGPSGGGKSTILRIIAGLETADAGSVILSGDAVDHLHPRNRQVGFVFQHYALFRHMTVSENIAFGLKVRKVPKEQRDEKVHTLLELMGLKGFGDRMPNQLSGGQRQRVALARALAPQPRLLLLDEPFGAVDAKVREELRRWLRRLHDEINLTSLFVTHDQEEAFAVSDRVLIINQGRLEQVGPPREILEDPATEFVASFVGDVNVFDCGVEGSHAALGSVRIPVEGFGEGDTVRMVIRCYDLKFWREEEGVGTVDRVMYLGDRVKVEAKLDGAGHIFAQFPRRSSLLKGIEPGCRIGLEVTKSWAFASTRKPPK